ncbi:hypothetical protein E8E13_000030 [Curvularia kusanoi]|uniref:Uncharacterized protein n=1 Tax=Curvularia kusanoi TaxID=90978 RepID=A0A9P4W1G1_CURKU|nr:hypothetical protein E8E13_000030 [Curvularia kusanoi]
MQNQPLYWKSIQVGCDSFGVDDNEGILGPPQIKPTLQKNRQAIIVDGIRTQYFQVALRTLEYLKVAKEDIELHNLETNNRYPETNSLETSNLEMNNLKTNNLETNNMETNNLETNNLGMRSQ